MKKKTIIDEYFDEQIHQESKYGSNTIILMEIGSFYEIYEINNSEEKIGKATEIAKICNLQLTRKNKSILENNRKNPLMVGVPSSSLNKYIDIIQKNGKYTLVVISQVTPAPNPKREITVVLSPGTTMNESVDYNYLASLYIEKYKEDYNIGLSILDTSTNTNKIFEFNSTKEDKELPLDDIYRILKKINISEILINYYDKNLNYSEYDNIKKFIINYLGIENIYHHFYINIKDQDLENKNFQNEFLSRIFKNETKLSIIEYLNLEFKDIGLISYIYLLKFAFEHNERLLESINKPIIEDESNILLLESDAIKQLNLINTNSTEINSFNKVKYNSLFDLLNKTSTSLGSRMLKNRLLNPLTNILEINKRYIHIEEFLKLDKLDFLEIEQNLNQIIDIQKYHRKMSLGILEPSDFFSLHISYSKTKELMNIVKEKLNIQIFENKDLDELNNIIENYLLVFNLDNIQKYHLKNINGNIFIEGFNSKIDNIQKDIFNNLNNLKKEVETLNNIFEGDFQYFSLKQTEKEGYYIDISKNKFNLAESILEKNSNNLLKNYKVTKLKSNVKLFNNNIITFSDNILLLEIKIKKEITNLYINYIKDLYTLNSNLFKRIENFIAILDVTKSNAKVSKKFNYFKPKINTKDNIKNSYIEAKNLRHPISEQILPNKEIYIPNDVNLSSNGILLYGLNSSGKSTYSKAIAINIIMAQAGMFVPSYEFIFNPYKKIFTRIDTTDDLFNNLSLFEVEMKSLKNILDRGDSQSLIFGDELAKGTEIISATSIVCSALDLITKKNMSFVFATHLHNLINIDDINTNDKIKIKHLDVYYNDKENCLIFNRKLKDGAGTTLYGLEVARSLNMNKDFINNANKIRRKLIENEDDKLSKIDNLLNNNKKSNYNSEIITSCILCGSTKNIHSHHINEQRHSNDNGFINQSELTHIHKNNKFNIISICEKHHTLIHNTIRKFNINENETIKYIKTDKGIKLWINNLILNELKLKEKKIKDLIIL